ncbi:MAG: hypothetical protein ACXWT3_07645 [Methylococcaceae bacterium]
MRQRLARFVRKSLAFSKNEELHRTALQLFIDEYNWYVPVKCQPLP